MGYYPLSGEPVEAGSLAIPKAVKLVQALQSQGLPYIRLIECLRVEEYEFVVVDVEPEVPQHPVHEVQNVERIAIGFNPADTEHQLIWALRENFPLVPHLHFGREGVPRSLCLYQIAYADLKPTWTAAALLRQLQGWLTQTARGELHAADQALEQAFYAPPERLVLPTVVFAPDAASTQEPLHVRFVSTVLGKTTLVASPAASAPEGQQAQFTSFVYTASPQVHGLIREQPRTIAELQTYLSGSDVDFTNALRRHLSALKEAQDFNRSLQLLIIVRLPKLRTATEAIETVEVWAFASVGTLAELGTDLGIWAVHENLLADLYPVDFGCTGQRSKLELLSPVRALTRDLAAAYNGLLATTTRFVAVGAGSLGSQVVNNLVRAGQGNWVWLV